MFSGIVFLFSVPAWLLSKHKNSVCKYLSLRCTFTEVSPASLLWLHFLPATFPIPSLSASLSPSLCFWEPAFAMESQSPRLTPGLYVLLRPCDLVVPVIAFTLATPTVYLIWIKQEVTGSLRKSLSVNWGISWVPGSGLTTRKQRRDDPLSRQGVYNVMILTVGYCSLTLQ